ncbi:MAG: hypothetical protein HXS54_04230 [Theionarchaea archaeon]|nr:hypothetical protein [Theionarchaea archaeon]
MSKKLREIKYYGPAKRAILIIPSQKEETMSYIANAVKSSVITPLTAALVIVVSAGVGYIMKSLTTVKEAAQPLIEEAAKEAPEMLEAPRMDSSTGVLSSMQPVFLVLLGCIITLAILGVYSYIKNKKGSFT